MNKPTFNCKFQAEIWLHGTDEPEVPVTPVIMAIRKIYEGRFTDKLSEETNIDLEQNSFGQFVNLQPETIYLIDVDAVFQHAYGDGDDWFDFTYTNFFLDLPNPLKLPLKQDQYDAVGYLENMQVGDYIVTTSGNVRLIQSDNMPDLHYSQIKRFATLEEVIKHTEVF